MMPRNLAESSESTKSVRLARSPEPTHSVRLARSPEPTQSVRLARFFARCLAVPSTGSRRESTQTSKSTRRACTPGATLGPCISQSARQKVNRLIHVCSVGQMTGRDQQSSTADSVIRVAEHLGLVCGIVGNLTVVLLVLGVSIRTLISIMIQRNRPKKGVS